MLESRTAKQRVWAYIGCVGCTAAALALFSGSALARTNPEGEFPHPTSAAADAQQSAVATFRAHSDLVLIPVTVTDTLNRFVLGFQERDFRLFEDGVEQNVALFSGEDAPRSDQDRENISSITKWISQNSFEGGAISGGGHLSGFVYFEKIRGVNPMLMYGTNKMVEASQTINIPLGSWSENR